MDNDLILTRSVSTGNTAARQQVTELALPLVSSKTHRFCKEFCSDNKHRYKCTLDNNWGNQVCNVVLCNWGNDSIAWMLNDLTSEQRLNNYQARGGSPLINYLSVIASSFQFKERWKDWRFGRRIRVPDYIKLIDEDACKVFRWLYDNDCISNIAQRLGRLDTEIDKIVKKIECELLKRNNLQKLQAINFYSLTNVAYDESIHSQIDIRADQPSLDEQLTQYHVIAAFKKLHWKEQYILEMTVVDKINARSVLAALVEQQLSLIDDVAPNDMTIAQVYYLRDKALNRLRKISRF